MKRWYVLHVETGREQTIDANLTAKQYETYCPLVFRDQRKFSRRPMNIVEALFPAYAFIQMDEDGDWEGVKVFGEMVQVLRGPDGYPEPIADDIIDLLKSRENEQGVHTVTAWRYRPGDKVVIKRGVPDGLKGREVIIEEIRNQLQARKLSVNIEIFGTVQKIDLKESDVEPV